jgi:hypothetical protein
MRAGVYLTPRFSCSLRLSALWVSKNCIWRKPSLREEPFSAADCIAATRRTGLTFCVLTLVHRCCRNTLLPWCPSSFPFFPFPRDGHQAPKRNSYPLAAFATRLELTGRFGTSGQVFRKGEWERNHKQTPTRFRRTGLGLEEELQPCSGAAAPNQPDYS